MTSEVRKVLNSCVISSKVHDRLDAAERADAARREEPVQALRQKVAELVAEWKACSMPRLAAGDAGESRIYFPGQRVLAEKRSRSGIGTYRGESMNLYSIHQPDPGSVDFGAEYWALVWADSEAAALAHYVDRYKGECDPRATHEEFAAQCVCTLKEGHGQTPEESGTHFERRREVERQLGYHCEGEDACESCGLYAMDMPEYWVCPECLTCVECGGHQDDCTEKDA